jgi:tRNA uridine 5-carbamoylmethylation protein Kti12
MLEIHDQKQVLSLIGKRWNEPVSVILTGEDYYDRCLGMIEKALCFLEPGREQYYNEDYFYEFFSSIQQISKFVTKHDWQQNINQFHREAILKYTDPNQFTLDGLYKGSFRIDTDRLLYLIDKVDMELPEKRVDFLKRVKVAQSMFLPTPSSKDSMKSAGV